ncbi:MAG: GatB/YqeY domain-containing protein [Candidatus Dadabacteria bacterium]|nr:GatB/YqeY domain-containing protein [Candidatus Dadabacteria bacterium]TDI90968.1 MAG: GatB/YqeY domain-containing protein [Candidatus Dadabacteria bacterium]TDJ01454.1 MAG: GatB/YqeY domain-containing protein [Candidatus Dadabacteria bacterium]
MGLRELIPEDLKNALRNKNTFELSVLRMLQAALINKEIDKRKEALTDEDVISVIGTEIKKRRDAAREFEKVNRPDAADQEKAEIEILMKYMPQQMSEDEIRDAVIKAVEDTQAESMQDIGKVMKVLMPQVKGKADGSIVNKIVKEALEGGE